MTDIDEIFYDSIDLLKEMIATPSTSRNESAVADVVERYLKKFGLNPRRIGNNLVCMAPDFDINRPTLLLDAHIDTVPPASGWKHEPYVPTEEDGRIYGLGSNDDGGSVVSLIAAFRMLCEVPQQYNLVLSCSSEEEVSGRNGIESVLPQLPPISVALVGEPTGMQVAIAERGLMVLDGVVHGVAGHAARDTGDNAIYKTMAVIEKLRNLPLEKESEMLGKPKITVTQIKAGEKHNIVPDRCDIVVDVRSTDTYSNTDLLELIRAAAPECEFTPRSTRLNSSSIATSHPLVRRAQMLGKELQGSVTMSNQALMPFPTIKMGPGDSNRSHTADEYICPDEIREAIDTYFVLLNGLKLD